MVALRKEWIGTRGAPEAAAWRSNAAWLEWAAVHVEFLAQSATQCFPAMGLDLRD